jgi:hypothetical protein
MKSTLIAKVIASVASIVVGGAVAAVTIVGVVSHGVNAQDNKPANVDSATIPYGSTQ